MCDLSRSMRIGSRTTWYLSLEELGASPNPSRDFLDQLQELSTFESCWSLASLETSPVQEQVTWGHCDDVHGRHSALSSCSSAVETSSGEICQQCPVRLYPGLQGCYCDNRIYQSVQRSPSEHVREFVYPESGPYSGNFQVQSNDVDADQRYGTFISPDSWSDVVGSIEDCVSGSVYGSALDCRSRLLERATGVVECSDQGPCCEFDSELDSTVGTNASPENQRECYYDDAQDVFCYLRIPETPANLYDVRSKVAEGRCNVNPDPDLGLSDNVGRYVEREGLCPVNLVHQNGAHQHPHPARSANFSAGRGGEDSGFASSGASSPAPGRPNSGCHGDAARRKRRGRRRHEEKYEICLGYPCYEFNLPDRHLLIYSLQKNKDLMEDLVGNSKLKNGFSPDTPKPPPGPQQHNRTASPSQRPTLSPDHPNPAAPITESPSTEMARVGWVLRTLILARAPNVIRDRKSSHHVFRRCAAGTELVDWLLSLSPAVHTRHQATAMWQALLEEGVISHVTMEQPFKDKFLFYRFWQDEEGASPLPSEDDASEAEDELNEVLAVLAQRGPDAMMRVILRKPSHERTLDDLETIYEELLHIKALSHLSNSVKRELAAVIVFEAHPRAGTVLFHQGDEGRSWYIILRGSVNVVIHGKGTVTSLQEGDDFGKLALINDAPRAATIVLREDNCHFLRVDKENFNRILRDVEANTVRLKEHGQDVLVLEKISSSHAVAYSQFKYTVMAGTPQKMLEHLLETRLDGRAAPGRDELPGPSTSTDPFLDDFLLTHIVFMPTHQLVTELGRHYRIDSPSQDREFLLACKRRVVQFVHRWVVAIRKPVFDEPSALSFMEDLANEVESDCAKWSSLREEAGLMHQVMSQLRRYVEEKEATSGQKWKLPPNGQPISLFGAKAKDHEEIGGRTTIRPLDDMIFRVYCADHTYCTLRFPVCTTAETIKHSAADKLGLKHDDLVLVEVKSSGERIVFKDGEVSIATGLSLNGRIFVSPREHLDALTPLPEQEAASGTDFRDVDLEMFSTKELAYHITEFDWNLFLCVHEYELIYHTFGRHHFRKITANLDVFLRRFNEIQFWIVTELCLTPNLSKRVQLLRKFIKLAAYCKEYQNLNAFFAIVMGLSNVAISRLSLTWEKLPSKFRKMYTEFESLIDPSRNHRSYRISVGKLQPPVIPFMPLLLKDMTFTHEGNKTSLDGLVNFEKMHMLAQTMRTIRYCRSRQLVLDPPTPKSEAEVRSYIRCLRIIDNQRVLTNLSQKLEPRRS